MAFPLLPVAAGGALAAGGSLGLAGGAGLGPDASPVVIGFGAGTIAVWLALRLRRSVMPTATPSRSREPPGPLPPRPRSSRAPSRVPQLPRSSIARPLSAPGKLVARPPTIDGASQSPPGDFVWNAWQTELGELPVGLVGPVPEVAYSPREPERLVVFPWAEGDVMFVDPSVQYGLSPIPAEAGGATPDPVWIAGATGPGSLEGLAFTVASVPSSGETTAPELASTSFGEAPAAGQPALSRTDLASFEIECATTIGPLPTPLQFEALTPVPPHLRRQDRIADQVRAPTVIAPNGIAPTTLPARRSAHCASCTAELEDPPEWRRCPGCQGSLCRGCTVAALVEHQRAWCGACAPAEPGVAGLALV